MGSGRSIASVDEMKESGFRVQGSGKSSSLNPEPRTLNPDRAFSSICRYLLVAVGLMLGAACASSRSGAASPSPSPAPPSTAPSQGGSKAGAKTYDNPKAHFSVQYPGDWH